MPPGPYIEGVSQPMRISRKTSSMKRVLPKQLPSRQLAALENAIPEVRGYSEMYGVTGAHDFLDHIEWMLERSRGMLVIPDPAVVSITGREDIQYRRVVSVHDVGYICISVADCRHGENLERSLVFRSGSNLATIPLLPHSGISRTEHEPLFGAKLYGPGSKLSYGGFDIATNPAAQKYWLPK